MTRKLGHDKVLVIAGDRGNVCTKPCEDQGAVIRTDGKMGDDFAIMLYAKRLVLSRSTIMRAVMFLSPVQKIWYLFGSNRLIDVGADEISLRIWPDVGPHYVCIASKQLEKEYVSNWRPELVPLLLTLNCTWYMDTGILIKSGTDTLLFPWLG
jgi:hypothetical protein